MPNKLPLDTQATRVFSGARAYFSWNNEQIGFASGCSGSEEITYEPIDAIGRLEVQEHVPTGYRVTFSAQVFRTIATGGTTANKPGSLKEQNIFPKFEEILKVLGVNALIQDQLSGKIIFKLEQVKCASYNFNITARGVVGQNVNFVAIRARDESEISGSVAG